VTFVEEASYVGRLNLIDLKFKDGLKIIQIFFSPNELDFLFLGQGIIGGRITVPLTSCLTGLD
jgi:hypothetical protein